MGVSRTTIATPAGEVAAVRALPRSGPAPGVLLAHDAWGLDEEAVALAVAPEPGHPREVAQRLVELPCLELAIRHLLLHVVADEAVEALEPLHPLPREAV